MKRLIGKQALIKFKINEPKVKVKIVDITAEGLFCEQNSIISFYFQGDIKEIILLPTDNWQNGRMS